jgi:hypothetical protein
VLGALALIACSAAAPQAFATTLYAEQNGGAAKGCPQGVMVAGRFKISERPARGDSVSRVRLRTPTHD